MIMIQEEVVSEEAREGEGEGCGPVFGGGIGGIFDYLRSGGGVVVARGFFVFEWRGRAVLLLLLLKERRWWKRRWWRWWKM